MAIRRAALATEGVATSVDTSKPHASAGAPSTLRHQHQERQARVRSSVATARPCGRIDMWSVLKISLCFYLCALIVMLVAGVMLWSSPTPSARSTTSRFFGELSTTTSSTSSRGKCCAARPRSGSCSCALMTIVTVLAAAFYNLFSELIGGIEIVVSEESEHRRSARCRSRSRWYAPRPHRGYSSVG